MGRKPDKKIHLTSEAVPIKTALLLFSPPSEQPV